MPSRRLLAVVIAQALALPAAQAALITVDSDLDGLPADDGVCTLREAIENANTDSQNGRTSPGECAAGSGADDIQFAPSVFGTSQTITMSQGPFAVTDAVSITGPGRDLLTIDADAQSRLFEIDNGENANVFQASMSDLTLTGGLTNSPYGGAINTLEDLSLARVTLTGNEVLGGAGKGGALHSDVRDLPDVPGLNISLDDIRMENNQAGYGGGLYLRLTASSTVTITNSVFDSNTANARGGGGLIILEPDSTLVLRDSTISSNSVPNSNDSIGGMLINAESGGDVLVERVEVRENYAQGRNGGLAMRLYGSAASYSSMRLVDSVITGNETGGRNAGLDFFADGLGTFVIERTTVSGNTAGGDTGGVYLGAFYTTLQMVDSTISGNQAGRRGGGVYAYAYQDPSGVGSVEILRTTIVGNTADADGNGDGTGGGIRVNNSSVGTLRIEGSIVAGNRNASATTPMPDLDADLGGDMTLEVVSTLIGDNSGSGLIEAPLGFPDVDGNLIGDPAGNGVIDPKVLPLADNGGLTSTHDLSGGSPAIDAAGACTGVDQRGQARPIGAACDMGAVETDALFGDGFE